MARKIKILVVDDERIVIDSVKRHLRDESEFEVLEAERADKALEILDKEDVDIVLTDLMMPEIDGLELLAEIKKREAPTITIMITGYATINTALQAQHLGAFDYIAKPFTKSELKKIVRRAAELAKAYRQSIDGETEEKIIREERLRSGLKGAGENSWLMILEDGLAMIGVERPVLYSIGAIQSVYLPEVGDELRQGSVYFQIFSKDLRSESLTCPLSGTVKEVNKLVLENPNEALQDPYGKGWLIKLSPSKFEEERKTLGL